MPNTATMFTVKNLRDELAARENGSKKITNCLNNISMTTTIIGMSTKSMIILCMCLSILTREVYGEMGSESRVINNTYPTKKLGLRVINGFCRWTSGASVYVKIEQENWPSAAWLQTTTEKVREAIGLWNMSGANIRLLITTGNKYDVYVRYWGRTQATCNAEEAAKTNACNVVLNGNNVVCNNGNAKLNLPCTDKPDIASCDYPYCPDKVKGHSDNAVWMLFRANWFETPGGYYNYTFLHEFGHALGLTHPHEEGIDVGVKDPVSVVSYNKSRRFTVFDAESIREVYNNEALKSKGIEFTERESVDMSALWIVNDRATKSKSDIVWKINTRETRSVSQSYDSADKIISRWRPHLRSHALSAIFKDIGTKEVIDNSRLRAVRTFGDTVMLTDGLCKTAPISSKFNKNSIGLIVSKTKVTEVKCNYIIRRWAERVNRVKNDVAVDHHKL